MTPKVTRILVQILLLGWILSVYSLYPLPLRDIEYLDQNRATLQEIIVAEAKNQGRRLSDSEIAAAVENQSKLERTRIWARWLVRAIVVILGTVSVLFYVSQLSSRWLWGVIATSIAFLASWIWPYVTTGDSIVASYSSFALGVIASGSSRLATEFLLFNAILPILHSIALVALLWFASGRGKVASRP